MFRVFSKISIVLQADYIAVVEDGPVFSVKYCLPVPVFHSWIPASLASLTTSTCAYHLSQRYGHRHLRLHLAEILQCSKNTKEEERDGPQSQLNSTAV